MSNQPNEAAIEVCQFCGQTPPSHGICQSNQCTARIILLGQVSRLGEEITSLRSALANAQKRIEEHERWRTQHGAAYQQVADARDAALAKLAEATKSLEEQRRATLDAVADGQRVGNELLAKLAKAEKSLATVTGDCARYHGMFEGTTHLLLRARQERDALRSQSDAQLAELHRISEALGTRDGHSSVDNIVALDAQLAEARWIPVTERIPEIGTEVLAVFPCEKADTVFIVLHDGMTWYDRDGNTFAMHPIWWQPLLAPPSDRSAEGA